MRGETLKWAIEVFNLAIARLRPHFSRNILDNKCLPTHCTTKIKTLINL